MVVVEFPLWGAGCNVRLSAGKNLNFTPTKVLEPEASSMASSRVLNRVLVTLLNCPEIITRLFPKPIAESDDVL